MTRFGIVAGLSERSEDPLYPVTMSHVKAMIEYFVSQGDSVCVFDWADVGDDCVARRAYQTESSSFKPQNISNLDLVFVKGLGKIHTRRDQFLNFLRILDSSDTFTVNPPETMRINLDKRYLINLMREGYPVVPTFEADYEGVQKLRGRYEDMVLKPRLFGESGHGVRRISEFSGDQELREYISAQAPVIAQPFMRGIKDGEISLAMLGDEVTLTVRKSNPRGGFKVNYDGYTKYARTNPTAEEVSLAREIIQNWRSPVYYGRIDMIRQDGQSYLSEAEFINPALLADEVGLEHPHARMIHSYLDGLVRGRER